MFVYIYIFCSACPDADPERRAAYLEKQREAWHRLRSQGKVKTVADMSKREGLLEESKTEQQRERKSRLENVITPPDSPDNHPPQSSR